MRKNYYILGLLAFTSTALFQMALNSEAVLIEPENDIVHQYADASFSISNSSQDYYDYDDNTNYIVDKKSVVPFSVPKKEKTNVFIGPRPYVESIVTTFVEAVEITTVKQDKIETATIASKDNALLAITCAEVIILPGSAVPVEAGNVNVFTDSGLCSTEVSFVWPTTTGGNHIELRIDGLPALPDPGILQGDFLPVSLLEGSVTSFQFQEVKNSNGVPTGSECNFTVTVIDNEAPTGATTAGSTGNTECSSAVAAAYSFDAAAAAGGYSDNCGGTVIATETGTEVITGSDATGWTVTLYF